MLIFNKFFHSFFSLILGNHKKFNDEYKPYLIKSVWQVQRARSTTIFF